MDLEWLKNDSPQIIRFRDRKEYKKNGVFHNINGPAVKSLIDSTPDQFYIKGERLEYEEWQTKSLILQRKRKIKR
jgi:hypothetical protein